MYARNNNNPNQYLVQKIMTASPNQLVAYIYDAGATACSQKDADKARRAVQMLVNGLNFEVKEVSITFFRVYQYLNHLINRNRFNEAKALFQDLKQTWAKAFNVQ